MKTSIRLRPTLLRGLALLSIATAAVAVAPPADDAKAAPKAEAVRTVRRSTSTTPLTQSAPGECRGPIG